MYMLTSEFVTKMAYVQVYTCHITRLVHMASHSEGLSTCISEQAPHAMHILSRTVGNVFSTGGFSMAIGSSQIVYLTTQALALKRAN